MKSLSLPGLIPLTSILATTLFLPVFPVKAAAGDTITRQAAASELLFLPAPISAKIDKGHAAAYAFKVQECYSFEQPHRQTFNAYAETLAQTAEAMKSLIGSNDPFDKWTLDGLKKFSTECFESYRTEHLKPGQKYERKIRALYPACKGWFSKPADRILLHRWTNRLLRGVESSNEAFADLAFAFKRLSREDIAGAQALNTESSRIIKMAEPLINEAYAGLRALKR